MSCISVNFHSGGGGGGGRNTLVGYFLYPKKDQQSHFRGSVTLSLPLYAQVNKRKRVKYLEKGEICIGNHMLLSAIIPKLHEKACNCLQCFQLRDIIILVWAYQNDLSHQTL